MLLDVFYQYVMFWCNFQVLSLSNFQDFFIMKNPGIEFLLRGVGNKNKKEKDTIKCLVYNVLKVEE